MLSVYAGIGAQAALLAWRAFVPGTSWPRNLDYAALVLLVLLVTAGTLPPIEYSGFVCGDHGELCVANLKQIKGAKVIWAQELKKSDADVPSYSDIFGPTNYIREASDCPAGGTYRLGAVREDPTCSSGQPGHRLGPPVPKPRRIPEEVLKASAVGSGAIAVVIPAMLLTVRSRRRLVVS